MRCWASLLPSRLPINLDFVESLNQLHTHDEKQSPLLGIDRTKTARPRRTPHHSSQVVGAHTRSHRRLGTSVQTWTTSRSRRLPPLACTRTTPSTARHVMRQNPCVGVARVCPHRHRYGAFRRRLRGAADTSLGDMAVNVIFAAPSKLRRAAWDGI